MTPPLHALARLARQVERLHAHPDDDPDRACEALEQAALALARAVLQAAQTVDPRPLERAGRRPSRASIAPNASEILRVIRVQHTRHGLCCLDSLTRALPHDPSLVRAAIRSLLASKQIIRVVDDDCLITYRPNGDR